MPNISKLLKLEDNKINEMATIKFEKHKNRLALKWVNPELIKI